MNSHQNPATPSAAEQVNTVVNQQMCNVGGLYPNNTPIVAPPCFMNFPFPVQFPNGAVGGFNPHQNFSPFPPVNQFNPSPQQQGHLFVHNPMNPNQNIGLPRDQHQLLLQNTIQNISQLLQLQNPNYAQCLPANFPMFQNQIGNVLSHQNPGFPTNHQNMGQQLQGNPFLPVASASVQTQSLTNFQNQIPQGVGPQYSNFPANQIANTGQTQNPCSSLTNFKNVNGLESHGNVPTNINGGWAEPQHKNFTGHKTNDASHKGFKTHKHVKEKFGTYNGYKNKDGNRNSAVDSGPQNSTNFEKKVPSLNYTEQEIKQWREARKKNYPANVNKCKNGQTLSDVTNQEAMLRRQQLKEILAKQAELGCEVAEIPPSYLSGPDQGNLGDKKHESGPDQRNPRDKKHESGPDQRNPRDKKHERQQYKKGKFQNKRGNPTFQDNRIAKKTKGSRDQNSFKHKPKQREPSLLQKLLTRDVKRDKNHLLQVFRFIKLNSFFTSTGKSLRFPSAIVREETNPVVPKETSCSVFEGNDESEEEEEGEITD